MQISQGKSIIHLDGHSAQETPPSSIRIPVRGLEHFLGFLLEKNVEGYESLKMDRPRGSNSSRDLYIKDPFGNSIVFWEVTESDAA